MHAKKSTCVYIKINTCMGQVIHIIRHNDNRMSPIFYVFMFMFYMSYNLNNIMANKNETTWA